MPSSKPVPAERRRALRVLLGGGLALVGAGLGTVAVRACRASERARAGSALAAEAYEALAQGDLRAAVAKSTEARARDPEGREPLRAWIHSVGVDLLEGPADAHRAVGFVSEVRRLALPPPGARVGAMDPATMQTDLAFTLVASAVSMRNDRFAKRLVEQHSIQGVTPDAFYDYAAGCALDLDCDPQSAALRFEVSAAAHWADSAARLPALRRARSLLLDERTIEARRLLDSLEGTSPAANALGEILLRLSSPRTEAAPFDRAAILQFPRSLHALAYATLLPFDDGALPLLTVALADTDSPLVATTCAKIALSTGRWAAAEAAAEKAREARSELPAAAALLTRARLLRGDLGGASEAATSSGESELRALVGGILAYEERDEARLEKLESDMKTAPRLPWSIVAEARRGIGRGERPSHRELSKAYESHEPWADIVLFDLALETNDYASTDEIADRWAEEVAAVEPAEGSPRGKRLRKLEERRGH